MPQAWSAKRERQYEHVKESELEKGESEDRAKEIAARTVNKARAEAGEVLASTGGSRSRSGSKSKSKSSGSKSKSKSKSSGSKSKSKSSGSRSKSKSSGSRSKR